MILIVRNVGVILVIEMSHLFGGHINTNEEELHDRLTSEAFYIAQNELERVALEKNQQLSKVFTVKQKEDNSFDNPLTRMCKQIVHYAELKDRDNYCMSIEKCEEIIRKMNEDVDALLYNNRVALMKKYSR